MFYKYVIRWLFSCLYIPLRITWVEKLFPHSNAMIQLASFLRYMLGKKYITEVKGIYILKGYQDWVLSDRSVADGLFYQHLYSHYFKDWKKSFHVVVTNLWQNLDLLSQMPWIYFTFCILTLKIDKITHLSSWGEKWYETMLINALCQGSKKL